jgi:hypothetical protein
MATSDAINSINIVAGHMSMILFGRAREALSNDMFDIHYGCSYRKLSFEIS